MNRLINRSEDYYTCMQEHTSWSTDLYTIWIGRDQLEKGFKASGESMEGSHRTYLHNSLAGTAVESGSSLRESSLGEGLSVCVLSRVPLCKSIDCSPPGSSVHGIFQARIWSELPFPSPGYLPEPGIEPTSLVFLSWAGRFYTITATWVKAAEFLERLAIRIKGKV